jgi:aminopeptidase N
MRDAAPQPIRLAEYAPPHHRVEAVHLTVRLAPAATRVLARIRFLPNPANPGPLVLDGEALRLIRATVDGSEVAPEVTPTGLVLHGVPEEPFTWEAEVEIAPEANTALEGLYMSSRDVGGGETAGRGRPQTRNVMYCTQCEAEGFRKITYYPDRPDVMAPFTVRIEGSPEATPVLLSNGNLTAAGPGWAEWHDPWPKPAYLFALVAGDLVAHADRFTTMSGRTVDLKIWVRPGDEGKCAYAMDALKRSMAWDEAAYGREYDLDLFQIVAVDDFNMGAMENKGLNIFNSKYVLASPETATDRDYEFIEGIIAHEYFHNWTGNRITCRDWFQLCLKEGLTVFRDQQFSGDQRSAAVKRIEDVLQLRARQIREDAGPLAHPVRPDSYIEINNFYTATVYEKGAEVIGMLRTLIGPEAYRAGCDLYFERHDGQACTIEDWLSVFEEVTGRDLSQFKLWYTEPGTPRLTMAEDWRDGTLTLTFTQENPKSASGAPQVIPIAVGLLGPNGDEVAPTRVLEMTEATQSFAFPGLGARPVPSVLRGFSAPVVLERAMTPELRTFLLAHDTDPFNRWEAGRGLAREVLLGMIRDETGPEPAFFDALGRMASDDSLDPAFRALALGLPSEDDLAGALAAGREVPDPLAIHAARLLLSRKIGRELGSVLGGLYDRMATPGPYDPEAGAAGRRALRAAALGYLSHHDDGARATALAASADNMTETLAALGTLLRIGQGGPEPEAFHARWQHDPLVLDKWFSLQVLCAPPARTVEVTEALTRHPDFDWKTPNRFRAVLGALTQSPAGFHDPSGAGYRLMTDWLLKLDPLNPQTAARMSTAFETWTRYDADRKAMIAAELDRILATEGLSRDLGEMAGRMRAAG